jgi:hypothetical protein
VIQGGLPGLRWLGGFGTLAPLRPIRPRARSAGWGLGGRVSVGAGPGRLWGDVLSTHCEETGGCDSPLRRLAERVTAGQGRRGARSRPMEHIFPTSIGPLCQAGTWPSGRRLLRRL